MATAADITATRRAIELATRGLGSTIPDPVVGRVVSDVAGRIAAAHGTSRRIAPSSPSRANVRRSRAGADSVRVGRLAPALPGSGPAAFSGAGISTVSRVLRLHVTETGHTGPDPRINAVPTAAPTAPTARKGN